MKKINWLIFCFGFFANGYSQIEHKIIDRADGSLQYFYTTTEIEGSPFLKDSWNKADAVTADGYRFSHLDVKYDIYNCKFIYNKNDTAFEFTPQINLIKVFPKENDTIDKQVFKRGFDVNKIVTPNKFLQVLAEGQATLLKFYTKEIENFDVYGDAKKHQRFLQKERYYLLLNNQYTQVWLTKKDLQNALASKQVQIDSYMQKNNLSGKDEKSWIAVISCFNGL